MSQLSVYKLILTLLITFSLVSCGNDSADKTAAQTSEPADVIARVGDEVISYSQLKAILNSAATDGVPVAPPGTPERNQIMQMLLEKLINANLVYLDAKSKGSDRSESFTADIKRYEDAMLASMYKTNVMIGEIPVGETEVIHYYNTQTKMDMPLTDEVKRAIEARIRQQRVAELESTLRQRLRENVAVVIDEQVMSPDYDDKRKDADTVATVDKQPVSWSQVKQLMQVTDQQAPAPASYIDSVDERLKRLEQYIDNTIMTNKGRAFGLEKDPAYIERVAEYRKAFLINAYSSELIQQWIPSPDVLKSFYDANMKTIVIPAAREVQKIVVATKEEADSIKAKIDAGEITMAEAAQQFSIDPDAKTNMGDMGWVKQGADADGLDELIFKLEPDVIGGPVESPEGWQLLKVQEASAAQFDNFDDDLTQNRTLMAYMQGKFTDYIAELRKSQFKVVMYDDELISQLQKEVDDIAELNKKAEEKSKTPEKPVEKLNPWTVQPAAE
jgi:parvulin-like peptidyl-prolyl isomerase